MGKFLKHKHFLLKMKSEHGHTDKYDVLMMMFVHTTVYLYISLDSWLLVQKYSQCVCMFYILLFLYFSCSFVHTSFPAVNVFFTLKYNKWYMLALCLICLAVGRSVCVCASVQCIFMKLIFLSIGKHFNAIKVIVLCKNMWYIRCWATFGTKSLSQCCAILGSRILCAIWTLSGCNLSPFEHLIFHFSICLLLFLPSWNAIVFWVFF